MKNMKSQIFLTVLISFSVCRSHAEIQNYPMSVNTSSLGESAVGAPASGLVSRVDNKQVVIKIINSCFPTNLRSVGNPLAPQSIIKTSFDLAIGGKNHSFWVEYPASLVTAAGMTTGGAVSAMAHSTYSSAEVSSAAIYGNTVILKTPFKSGVSVDGSGKINKGPDLSVSMSNISFSQTVTTCSGGPVYGAYGYSSFIPTYNCGNFMGKTGTLSASIGGIAISSDATNIEINVSFPGQTGFCGGFWSPLMVFFDEQRPTFDNSSKFPLNPGGETMWPRADHAGWFLALDRDGNGLIDKKNELFGADDGVANGFEALKKLDSNNDGVIDAKDKEFKNLVLWKDKNGDGVSQPEELIKLSEKVIKISLKYSKDTVQPLGKNAEERERSFFWYRDGKGKIKKGAIIDIWIAPK
ncbi:MAG: EF-hand domain-containing protein [Pseudobdellovibrionaceae bacterium]